MNTYWISLPCDLLSSLASFQCSLLHHLHLSSDLGLSNYVNQHSHLNLSRNVRLPVLYDLDFNSTGSLVCASSVLLHVVFGVVLGFCCDPSTPPELLSPPSFDALKKPCLSSSSEMWAKQWIAQHSNYSVNLPFGG